MQGLCIGTFVAAHAIPGREHSFYTKRAESAAFLYEAAGADSPRNGNGIPFR